MFYIRFNSYERHKILLFTDHKGNFSSSSSSYSWRYNFFYARASPYFKIWKELKTFFFIFSNVNVCGWIIFTFLLCSNVRALNSAVKKFLWNILFINYIALKCRSGEIYLLIVHVVDSPENLFSSCHVYICMHSTDDATRRWEKMFR